LHRIYTGIKLIAGEKPDNKKDFAAFVNAAWIQSFLQVNIPNYNARQVTPAGRCLYRDRCYVLHGRLCLKSAPRCSSYTLRFLYGRQGSKNA
jgi:hypothetical protein